jgi:ATP-dependent RNA helicase RhlE
VDVSAFAALGLSGASLASVQAAGFTTPTPVQARTLPPAMSGRDIIATAATGTGKTLAFVLPIIERLAGGKGTRALVLAPTRELVQQIAEVVRQFGARRGVRCVEVVGGVGMGSQVAGLRERRDVIVATPGRLVDHLDRGTARLGQVEVLVLDEADRMLDMGFRSQLDRILRDVPSARQTMLLSATMGAEVAEFARACLKDPVRVETAPTGTVAARAEQRVFHVAQDKKVDLLLALLAADQDTTLVFTRTKHRAEKLAKQLGREGHRVARIHGNRSQSQRNAALDGFRTGGVRVLVATDVAARGLDVEEIGHVVNFDLSLVPDDHVHRVGRTARAAASGRASSFCSPEEAKLLREIEKFTRTAIARAPLPEGITAPATPLPEPYVPAAKATATATSPNPRPQSDRPQRDGAGPRGPRRDGRPGRPHDRSRGWSRGGHHGESRVGHDRGPGGENQSGPDRGHHGGHDRRPHGGPDRGPHGEHRRGPDGGHGRGHGGGHGRGHGGARGGPRHAPRDTGRPDGPGNFRDDRSPRPPRDPRDRKPGHRPASADPFGAPRQGPRVPWHHRHGQSGPSRRGWQRPN